MEGVFDPGAPVREDEVSRWRAGGWFMTESGIKFDVLAPTPDMVNIEDIAHALAHICRFNGHCRSFYSVAQHSVIVSKNLPAPFALAGLMHDAAEAYCGDVIRPIKVQLPDYRAIEGGIQRAIHHRYGMLAVDAPEVKEADERALMTERRDLLRPSDHVWSLITKGIAPYDEVITPWPPTVARDRFLRRYRELGGQP